MTAALSKALEAHDPNWLAKCLAEKSYVRRVAGTVYAVVVSPGGQQLAVYSVTPRRMRVRQLSTWPSGVVDSSGHTGVDKPGASLPRPSLAVTMATLVDRIADTCQRTEALCGEIAALREAQLRACQAARETLAAAESALVLSRRALTGHDPSRVLTPVRMARSAGPGQG